MTFFSSIQHYSKLPDDRKIRTEEFLAAARDLSGLCDLIGSPPLGKIKERMQAMCEREKVLFESSKEEFEFLDAVIAKEAPHNELGKGPPEGLLMIIKASEFLWRILLNIVNGEKNLHTCAKNAHAEVLKPYQPFLVRNMFSVGLKAVADMQSFLKKVGKDASEEQVLCEMSAYADNLGQNVQHARDAFLGYGK